MREYKFRGWDNDIEKMFYEDFYLSLEGNLYQGDELEYKNKRRFEIMQYTGFQDCYGKDIYEGDIIQYGNTQRDCGAVIMDGGMWYIQDLDRLVSLGYPKIYASIIGNIYENPELITA